MVEKKKKKKLWFEGKEKGPKNIRMFRDDDDLDKQMKNMFSMVSKMFGKNFMRGFSQPVRTPIRFNIRVKTPKMASGIPINMRDTGKELVLQASLPGVKKENVNLNVTSNCVDIAVMRQEKKLESKENFYSQASSSSTVRRTVRLPVEIKEDEVRAKFMEGNLIIVLPKLRQKRRVEVE